MAQPEELMRKRGMRIAAGIGIILLLAAGVSLRFGLFERLFEQSVPTITEITIICSALCIEQEAEPQGEKTFREPYEIAAFDNAIGRAARMLGILNYAAEFGVHVKYSDGMIESFDLAIGRERGKRGMYVRHTNTHQGYIIHEQDADRLRDMIYGRE